MVFDQEKVSLAHEFRLHYFLSFMIGKSDQLISKRFQYQAQTDFLVTNHFSIETKMNFYFCLLGSSFTWNRLRKCLDYGPLTG